MSRFSRIFVVAATTAFVAASLAQVAAAQAVKELEAPEKVRFETADGVTIRGVFYRPNAKAAPVVIMLHNIGESSAKDKWIELAKSLQPSYAVLTFDFRGHGDSVDIDPAIYFKYPANVAATKGGANIRKTKLDKKDLNQFSLNLLINDIAAAKGYLERTKNDLGVCNVQNTVVIGVDQSATLAAIWANSEWRRYKFDINPLLQPIFQNRPEGQYLTSLVCLSISPKLGTRPVNLIRTLEFPCRQNGMPAVFLYGDGDAKDLASVKEKESIRALEKAIKAPPAGKKDDPRFAFTKAIELKGAGKLRGVDLLAKSLNTGPGINAYLSALFGEKSQEWSQRDFVKSKFAWKISANPDDVPLPAKVFNYDTGIFPLNPFFPLGVALPDCVERNLAYETYEIFIGR